MVRALDQLEAVPLAGIANARAGRASVAPGPMLPSRALSCGCLTVCAEAKLIRCPSSRERRSHFSLAFFSGFIGIRCRACQPAFNLLEG
jgi:hypothetical protein